MGRALAGFAREGGAILPERGAPALRRILEERAALARALRRSAAVTRSGSDR